MRLNVKCSVNVTQMWDWPTDILLFYHRSIKMMSCLLQEMCSWLLLAGV